MFVLFCGDERPALPESPPSLTLFSLPSLTCVPGGEGHARLLLRYLPQLLAFLRRALAESVKMPV